MVFRLNWLNLSKFIYDVAVCDNEGEVFVNLEASSKLITKTFDNTFIQQILMIL